MAELSTGTVTFLLSDIEGSVPLWEQNADAMQRALTRHDALVSELVTRHDGTVVHQHGEGDSRFAVFARAEDAVVAACDLQRAFQREQWSTAPPLRIRMALHTGEAIERAGHYYGSTVNRCARLRGLGHGGQVLLSEATATLVRGALPIEVVLRDLDDYSLRGFERPERVYQIVHPELPADFPPLVGLRRGAHNLPAQTTPLIGRAKAVEDVCELLRRGGVRLLTLTGPGGIGKTRVGLQVAADLVSDFADGVFFVPLATISDPAHVDSTVAQVLGLRAGGGRAIRDTVHSYLKEKRLLLLLDNFEQVLPAASLVADLLAACPGLKILVTSRSVLHVRGEYEYMVEPLACPDPDLRLPVECLAQFAAVVLFIRQAASAKSDFSLNDVNAPAVAGICHRLHGLPLAIELAAARAKTLSPPELLARLKRRLPLLTGGARDLPERQRTLRNTIAWSYALLEDAERSLFRRLSVFVGGFTLEAAEAVCSPERGSTSDVLDGVASLVGKSLLRPEDADGGARFGMLEAIREYALEELKISGEASSASLAHAAYFFETVRITRTELFGAKQRVAARWFAAEYGNLRAALGRSRSGEIPVDIGMGLACMLEDFWALRSPVREGRDWAEAMLRMPGAEARASERAGVLLIAAVMVSRQADYAAARSFAQESIDIFREVGDLQGTGRALTRQSVVELIAGNSQRAQELFEESIVLARSVGDRHELAFALSQLGAIAQGTGDFASARSLRTEAAAIAHEIGNGHLLGLSLAGLASVAREQDNSERAAELFKEALIVSSELQDHPVLLRSLAGLAGIAGLSAGHERAARLFGLVEVVRKHARCPRFRGGRRSTIGTWPPHAPSSATRRSALRGWTDSE
jgi:predicted ATPase/class 3 adenylate cyclase